MKIEASTSVGDIAATSAAAASVLERYGIDYCCHGKSSLEDACREKGVSPENIKDDIAHAITGTPATSTDWNTAPLRDLIDHIVTKHHEYLKLELPRVGQRVRTVARVHGEKDPAALHELEQVYDGLAEEMNLHMHKEEMMLFPAIERSEAASQGGGPLPRSPFGTIANPISVMEHEHDSAGNALLRIRELTRGFEAPPYACSTYRAMLEGLKALEADLHIHIHLENNILFPRAIALERNN
ncbi:MAG: iron-sulfur cluster repair di-iron protein [Bryobacterales bacterium]|nr:iron-sulfur cluster repair di-iron protein [Bryobacterales bacterium]